MEKVIENLQNGNIKQAALGLKGGAGGSVETCVIKGTETLSHRNAPVINEAGQAEITSLSVGGSLLGAALSRDAQLLGRDAPALRVTQTRGEEIVDQRGHGRRRCRPSPHDAWRR